MTGPPGPPPGMPPRPNAPPGYYSAGPQINKPPEISKPPVVEVPKVSLILYFKKFLLNQDPFCMASGTSDGYKL